MLLYVCFRFSEVMDQMFLTVRGVVQGSFMATLGVPPSLFMWSYDQDGELEDVPHPPPSPPPPRFFRI